MPEKVVHEADKKRRAKAISKSMKQHKLKNEGKMGLYAAFVLLLIWVSRTTNQW